MLNDPEQGIVVRWGCEDVHDSLSGGCADRTVWWRYHNMQKCVGSVPVMQACGHFTTLIIISPSNVMNLVRRSARGRGGQVLRICNERAWSHQCQLARVGPTHDHRRCGGVNGCLLLCFLLWGALLWHATRESRRRTGADRVVCDRDKVATWQACWLHSGQCKTSVHKYGRCAKSTAREWRHGEVAHSCGGGRQR